MIDKNDWRLQGQEKYLKGVTLYLKKYIKIGDAWDHDHCEFCWAKLASRVLLMTLMRDMQQKIIITGYVSAVLAKNASSHMKFVSLSGKDCLKGNQIHRQKLNNRLNLTWACLVGTHY